MLAVAVPVCVVERPGIWASLARSRALTAGHRWKILGAMVLIGIIVSLVSLLAGIVSGGAGAMGALAVQFVLTALMGVWISVAAAVIYHDLRLLKEGGGPTGSVAPPV
jgi:hypothetical protein